MLSNGIQKKQIARILIKEEKKNEAVQIMKKILMTNSRQKAFMKLLIMQNF